MPRQNAFVSPTAASRERLGVRVGGSKNHGSDSSVRSRRTTSAISSAEDEEIFDRISDSTSVRCSANSKKDKLKGATSFEGSVGSMVGAIINSFSPVSSQDSQNNEQRSESVFSFSPPSQRDEAVSDAPKANLDLRNNDNSFHVLASLLVDFFSKKTDGEDCLTLVPQDRIMVQRLLPESARLAFIDAVRYRLELTPVVAATPLQFLTQQCQEFGLDQEDPQRNPILVANQLKDKAVKVHLASAALLTPRDKSDVPDDDQDDHENRTVESITSPYASPSDDDGVDDVKSPTSTVFSDDGDSPARSSSPKRNFFDHVFDAAKFAAVRRVFSAGDKTDGDAEDTGDTSSGKNQFLSDDEKDDSSAQPSELEAIVELNENESEEQELEQRPSTIEEGETEDSDEAVQNEMQGMVSHGSEMDKSSGNLLAGMRSLVDTTTTEESTRVSSALGPQRILKDPSGKEASSLFSLFFTGSKHLFAPNDDTTAGSKTEVTTGSRTAVASGASATDASTSASTDIMLINENQSEKTKTNPFHVDFARYEELEVLDEKEKRMLLTQLQEAQALLVQSETIETTRFWRERTKSLMNQLDSLAADCKAKDTQMLVVPADTSRTSMNTPSNNGNLLVVPADSSRTSIQNIQSANENMIVGPADSTRNIVLNQQSNRAAPDFLDAKQPDPQWYTQAKKQKEEATQPNGPNTEQSDVELPLVDVVAPADLPAGYNFEAEIEGQRFLATVPPGGVQQGETFTCYMRELDSVAIDIPVGYWKDGLCHVFAYGCCHPVVWHSLFCPLIALGQIQQRISLDFLGRPRFGDGGLSIRATVFIVISFWALTNTGIFAAYNLKWFHGMELTMADVSAIVLLNIAMFGYIVFVAQSTRASLRDKFMIREERCFDLEDLVCATACLPCTVGQMARHTANYDDYEAVCCSKTGLPDGIRLNQSAEKEVAGYVV